MPTDTSYKEYIPKFLQEFQALIHLYHIKSAYCAGVNEITTSTAMVNQVSNEGNYWKVLENATQEKVATHSCKSLSEILLKSTINILAYNMFGVKDESDTWTDSIKAFAYGT